jgi:DNA invertase Pin-like site-specific DNA recombinase
VKAGQLKDCIQLIRVSTLAQATEDKGGIDAQKAACKKIAEHRDLKLRWTIQLDGISGAAVKRSPKFQDLLSIVRSGQCGGIVLKETSRLLRPDSFGDWSVFEELQNHHVCLHLLDRVVDFSTPDGRFFATVMAAIDGLERAKILERTLGGKKAKRSRGEFVGGPNSIPVGMRIEQAANGVRRYAIDPETIGKVKRLFNLFVGGETSWKTLAAETGIGYYSIKRVLADPIYTGVRVIRNTVDSKKNEYRPNGTLKFQRRVRLSEADQERIPVFDNPPISQELFDQVQALLRVKTERRSTVRAGKEDPFIYRGYLHCAECGNPVDAIHWSDKRPNRRAKSDYYLCRSKHTKHGRWKPERGAFEEVASYPCQSVRIRMEVLHPLLDKIIAEHLGSKEFFLHAAEIHNKRLAAKQKDGTDEKELLAEITSKQRSIERLLDLHVDGKISLEVFDKKNLPLQAELAALNKALAVVKKVTPDITPERMMYFAKMFKGWPHLSTQEKRLALASLDPIFKVAGHRKDRQTEVKVEVLLLKFHPTDKQGFTVELSS